MPTNSDGAHENWRDLAEQASKETDPAKLQQLVKELCDAIDHQAAPQRAKPINRKTGFPVDE